jgi:hypothetical protein
LLAQGHVLEHQLSVATQRQRQAADNHNEQLQHGPIVAGVAGNSTRTSFGDGQEHWKLKLDQAKAARGKNA